VGKTISWFLAALLAASQCAAAGLTPLEQQWLHGAWPVLLYARDAGLPLDVVVQPQPTAGLPPMAMAYIDNRCKLVFSLRGNPDVESSAGRIEPELFDATLELMAAHELGHCRRHVDGAWLELPAGHVSRLPATLAAEVRAAYEEMEAVRREEGYADLVGLAWTQRHHAPLYARLQAWLVAERTLGRVPGGHHDTLAWARLADDAARLGGGSIFEAADALWPQGLDGDH
jgi:hypothetical protein